MRRLSTVWLAMTWLVVGMPQALASRTSAIPAHATLKAVEVADSPGGKEILLRIDGQYSFKTIRTPEGATYVDVQGARIGSIPPSARWVSGLLAGYHVIEYRDASGSPVVRVEIQTRGSEPPVPVQERSGLRLLLSQARPASSSNPTPPAEGAASSPGETTKEPVLVSDISVKQGHGGKVTIDVTTTKSAPLRVLRLADPDRLVVDLEGARYQSLRKSIPVSSPVVREVRVGQFNEKNPEVVRIVADLSGDSLFDTHAVAGGVRIEVRPRPKSDLVAAAPVPTPKVETAAKRNERNPIHPAHRATEGAGSSRAQTPEEPASNSARTRPSPARTLRGPRPNRLPQNSTPSAAPAAKDMRAGQSQAENPAGVPGVDEVLRYLFNQGTPPPGAPTSPPSTPKPLPAAPTPPAMVPVLPPAKRLEEPALPPVKTPEGPPLVTDILVRPGPAGEITIEVFMTKPSPIQVLRIGNPDRLVVDVPGARNQCPRKLIPVASPLVKDVRVGQFREENPEVARVVLDLSGNPVCSTHAYASVVLIEVKPRPVAATEGPGTAPSDKTR